VIVQSRRNSSRQEYDMLQNIKHQQLVMSRRKELNRWQDI
jgi:hypothetical protein